MSKFMYLRASRSEQPVGCVAFSVEGDTLSYQLSVLNPADKFDRTKGRTIAGGRLATRPISVGVPGLADMDHHEILTAVMQCVASTDGAPTRAVEVAGRWLTNNTPTDDEDGGAAVAVVNHGVSCCAH